LSRIPDYLRATTLVDEQHARANPHEGTRIVRSIGLMRIVAVKVESPAMTAGLWINTN